VQLLLTLYTAEVSKAWSRTSYSVRHFTGWCLINEALEKFSFTCTSDYENKVCISLLSLNWTINVLQLAYIQAQITANEAQ
jgi:hypothetical protein